MGHASGLILVALASTASAESFVSERVELRLASEVGRDTQSLALDGWYAVNERFRVGLTSSTDARRELGAGRGLCVRDCATRYGGLAAEAQIVADAHVIGRAAVDTTRFAPTASAIELGLDIHGSIGAFAGTISPVLRLGISRRDLGNGDSAGVLGVITAQLWSTGGVLAAARFGLDLDALRETPSFGAAGGVYVVLGAFAITAKVGDADALFGELALGWSS